MRLLLLAAAAALPASVASAPAFDSPAGDMPVISPGPVGSAECPPTSRFHMAQRQGKQRVKAQTLAELPPADAYLAVSRQIGRCEVPIIVRYGIGEASPDSR